MAALHSTIQPTPRTSCSHLSGAQGLAGAVQRGTALIAALVETRPLQVRSGSTIDSGSFDGYVLRVRSGLCCEEMGLADGRTQLNPVAVATDVLGLQGLLLEGQSRRVRAFGTLVLDRIRRSTLLAAFHADTDVAISCLHMMAVDVQRLQSWLAVLGIGDVKERMAFFLIDLQARLAARGLIAPRQFEFDMPLTQSRLAEFLGVTPIHLNRVLRAMREAGLCELSSGKVAIRSFERLASCAHPFLGNMDRTTPAQMASPAFAPLTAPRPSFLEATPPYALPVRSRQLSSSA